VIQFGYTGNLFIPALKCVIFHSGIASFDCIWINPNFSELLDKIHQGDAIFKQLEFAQTELLRAAKRAQKKQLEKGRREQGRSPTTAGRQKRKKHRNSKMRTQMRRF
jgi:hypothetical protein